MLFCILAGLTGYAIGSFPTAYLIVKWKSDLDIRKEGSGNVGTLNSYEVTNSKSVGVIVLLLDLLKGIFSVLLAKWMFGPEFEFAAWAGVGAVVGHNFPVWLGFKGGRGLATAAGVMLMIAWVFVAVWLGMWYVGNKFSKDVNAGNAVATVAMLVLALVVPHSFVESVTSGGASSTAFRVFFAALAAVILTRLVQPVREYLLKRTTS